jgi:hypothetical protein
LLPKAVLRLPEELARVGYEDNDHGIILEYNVEYVPPRRPPTRARRRAGHLLRWPRARYGNR